MCGNVLPSSTVYISCVRLAPTGEALDRLELELVSYHVGAVYHTQVLRKNIKF